MTIEFLDVSYVDHVTGFRGIGTCLRGQLFLSGNVIMVACGHNTWIFYYIFKYIFSFFSYGKAQPRLSYAIWSFFQCCLYAFEVFLVTAERHGHDYAMLL